MERKTAELTSSFVTVIFSIFAIAIYIAYGGGILSYTLIGIAIVIAGFNAWLIAREEKETRQPKQEPKRGMRKAKRAR